jgi:hypothetical protein
MLRSDITTSTMPRYETIRLARRFLRYKPLYFVR